MNKEILEQQVRALTTMLEQAKSPVSNALVQLGSIGGACVCGIFVPDPLIGVILALSSLAFGFFVTRLAKI